jgi:hypothetical protein
MWRKLHVWGNTGDFRSFREAKHIVKALLFYVIWMVKSITAVCPG